MAGTRGEISDNWSYEASVNYGEHKNRTAILGNVNIQRYLLAIVRWTKRVHHGRNGNIVCRSQVDPNAALA